jgi:hypothetical protein
MRSISKVMNGMRLNEELKLYNYRASDNVFILLLRSSDT